MLVCFLRGFLPWHGFKARDQTEKDELILQKKRSISAEELCRNLFKEFEIYFDYIRFFDFYETPSYFYLREIFRNFFMREGFEYDEVFDWTVLEYLRLCQAELTEP